MTATRQSPMVSSGGREEPVGPAGQVDGGDPDEPLGHRPERRPPGQGVVVVAPDVGEELDRRRWRARRRRRPPRPASTSADRSDVASEAAWNSLRLTSRKARTAPAISDSSKSAPATRWRKMVPPSRATATRQARRWPRRMPRPRAMRARPAMATRAPAATLARSGRNCSTSVETAAQGRGDRVEEVDDPGDEDGGAAPPADPAGAAVGLAEVGGGRPRGADRIGGDQRRVERAHRPDPG